MLKKWYAALSYSSNSYRHVCYVSKYIYYMINNFNPLLLSLPVGFSVEFNLYNRVGWVVFISVEGIPWSMTVTKYLGTIKVDFGFPYNLELEKLAFF